MVGTSNNCIYYTNIINIYMSYKTGKTEYAWIIGSMLFGIGSGSKYRNMKE